MTLEDGILSLALNPILMGYLIEGGALAYFGGKYIRDYFRERMGQFYRVRICVENGARLKQIGSKLVPINDKTFNSKKASYLIDPEKVLFNDPAPVLIYLKGQANALSAIDIEAKMPKDKLTASRLYGIIKEQTVKQLVQASKHIEFDPTMLVMGAAIGVVAGLVLGHFIPLFGK